MNQKPCGAEIRLYDSLFVSENPASLDNWISDLNPNSLTVLNAFVEPALAQAKKLDRFQFERGIF